jgi:hypothetical protein
MLETGSNIVMVVTFIFDLRKSSRFSFRGMLPDENVWKL